MLIPRFEVPAGAIDGSNTTFVVAHPYQAGSTAVFWNGVLMKQTNDDGWVETSPSLGRVDMKIAPKSTSCQPDVIQIFYLDTSMADVPMAEICGIVGRLHAVADLSAMLEEPTPIQGRLNWSCPS